MPDRLQIILIGLVRANVYILCVGAMAGRGQRSKSEKQGKLTKHNQKTQSGSRMVCLVTKKGKNRIAFSVLAFLKFLAGCFQGSEEIRDSLQIVLIGAAPANVGILYVRVMPGSGQSSRSEQTKPKRPNTIRKDNQTRHGILAGKA